MTQVGIKSLKGEMEAFREMLRSPRAGAKSKNQLEVEELRDEVRQLKAQLQNREAEVLYRDSIENDTDAEYRRLQSELRDERKIRKNLQRENTEFSRYLVRDQKRGRF